MSVPKYKRNESSMEFVDNALKLHIHTVKQCTSLPKRYTFYGLQNIANLSFQILSSVKIANSIFPTNEHEFQMRRDRLLEAYGYTQALISQVNALQEIFTIQTQVVMSWMELIQIELRCLKGVIKADKRNYKKYIQSTESNSTDETDSVN